MVGYLGSRCLIQYGSSEMPISKPVAVPYFGPRFLTPAEVAVRGLPEVDGWWHIDGLGRLCQVSFPGRGEKMDLEDAAAEEQERNLYGAEGSKTNG